MPEAIQNLSLTYLSNQQWQDEFSSKIVLYSDLFLTVNASANDLGRLKTTENRTMPMYTNTNLKTILGLNYGGQAYDIGGDNYLRGSEMVQLRELTSEDYDWRAETAGPQFTQVTYGHGRKVPPRKLLQISLVFMVIVIVCNVVKLAVMLWVLFAMDDSDFMVTMGDSASSFLKNADSTTESFCVFSKEAVKAEVAHPSSRRAVKGAEEVVELNTYKGSKLDDFDDMVLAQDVSFQVLKPDAIQTHSSATWRRRNVTYSSALGKDIGTGSTFMYVFMQCSFKHVAQILTCIGSWS